jgi:hypothetical protein
MINYCVLSAPRSGSNLLCALLNIHPDCVNRGEIFGKVRSFFIQDLLKFIEDTTSSNVPEYLVEKLLKDLWFFDYSKYKSIGFKGHYTHDYMTNGQIISFIKKNNIKIVHLKRKNKLKQIVSWIRALDSLNESGDNEKSIFFDNWMLYRARNPWTNKNNTLNPKKINIDVVLDQLSEFHKTEMFFNEVLSDHSNLVLEVYYEDLVKDLSVDFSNDNNIELQKCYDFLGLDYQYLINNKDIKVNNFLSKMDFMADPRTIFEENISNYKSYNKYFDRVKELENSKTFIMKKSRKWPLSECIKNYDELVNALEETEYEIYLDNNYHRLQMWRKK